MPYFNVQILNWPNVEFDFEIYCWNHPGKKSCSCCDSDEGTKPELISDQTIPGMRFGPFAKWYSETTSNTDIDLADSYCLLTVCKY